MSENREHAIRVNKADTAMLKAAKEEFDIDVPLGYVARKGAEKIIKEREEE